LYSRWTPLGDFLPATHGLTSKGFLIVENGGSWRGLEVDAVMPSLNCSPTKEQTQEYCASDAMKDRIVNTMARGPGRLSLMITLAVKGTCDLAHDWTLLAGYDSMSVILSVTSQVILGLAVVIAFSWCTNGAGTYAAHDPHADCTCYYQLTEAPVLISFAVPFSLLWHFVTRGKNLIGGLTYGLYLFSFREVVPIRLLRFNIRSGERDTLTDSMLMPEIVGDVAASNAQEEREQAFLEGRTPVLPSVQDLPRAMWTAIRSQRLSLLMLVAFPVAFLMVPLVSGIVQAHKILRHPSGFISVLNVCVLVSLSVLVCSFVLMLLIASSRQTTLEVRCALAVFSLQNMVVLTGCTTAQMDNLFARTLLYFLATFGMDIEVPPGVAKGIALISELSTLLVTCCYSLYFYATFSRSGRQRRPAINVDAEEGGFEMLPTVHL